MNIYFGQTAITRLREQGILKVYEDKCRQPYKLADGIEQFWIKDNHNQYRWEQIGDRIPLCGGTLFYQYANDNKIYCCICEGFGINARPEQVISWYQTTPRNTDITQRHQFTYAEKYAMESLNKGNPVG